ncbi:unnamed protein product [Diamesa hyperborea]
MGLVCVHTGAGNSVNEENYKLINKKACKTGTDVLLAGGSALDALEAAISILEDSAQTNAGYGSNLSWDKRVECEASCMDSSTLNFGACTNVSDVKNPISLARKICDKQSELLKLGRIPPMVMSGNGASNMAKELGLKIVTMDELISKRSLQLYDYYRNKITAYEERNAVSLNPLDTVGCVVIDDNGVIASGCSSGGIVLKLSGRVGQAATYGAGCWSQNIGTQTIGTCTTGNGEYLMKTLLAREICTNLANSDCPTTKLSQVFNEKFLKSPLLPPSDEFYGGALTIHYDSATNHGDLLWAHTTKMLCLAYKGTKQKNAQFIASSLPSNSTPGTKVIVSGIPFVL